MSERTAVYRLYGEADALLYVGVSNQPDVRLQHHARTRPWWPEVQRREIAWHPDRPSAITAEAVCIRADRPRYNAAVPQPDGSFTGAGRGSMRQGVSLRHFRLPDELWERFDEAVKQADPDSNRTKMTRKLIRWFVGDIDEMPQRPARAGKGAGDAV